MAGSVTGDALRGWANRLLPPTADDAVTLKSKEASLLREMLLTLADFHDDEEAWRAKVKDLQERGFLGGSY